MYNVVSMPFLAVPGELPHSGILVAARSCEAFLHHPTFAGPIQLWFFSLLLCPMTGFAAASRTRSRGPRRAERWGSIILPSG